MMERIVTDRLSVRNFRDDDWRDLQEMVLKYEASEYAQYDHEWPTSDEGVQGVAKWFAGGDGFLAVCLGAKVIGFVALNPEPDRSARVYNLGYVFNEDYHGHGHATEACRAVLDRAFGMLGADGVVTGTAAVNAPSRRLLERLGFRKTGEGTSSLRKRADGTPIEFLGLTFAISRDEWLANADGQGN
jgi:ribosomal-protein-alanine N-acetyltransferase